MTQPSKPPLNAPRVLPIMSSSHIPQLNVSLLYQGVEKSGKSTCALTWPSPFLFYYDKNLGVLRENPGIPYVTPRSWDEVESDWIPAIQNRRLSELVQAFTDENGQKPYPNYKVRTIVVDSFTNFLNMLYIELEQRAPRSEKSGEKDGFWIWREYFNRANRFINICCDSTIHHPKQPTKETYHFIGTIHEVNEYDDKGKLVETRAAVQGKLSSQFKSYFDAVLLTECIEGPPVEVPGEGGKPPTTRKPKLYNVSSADVGAARKSTISGEFTKLPPKLKGDYATINSYLKLDATDANENNNGENK